MTSADLISLLIASSCCWSINASAWASDCAADDVGAVGDNMSSSSEPTSPEAAAASLNACWTLASTWACSSRCHSCSSNVVIYSINTHVTCQQTVFHGFILLKIIRGWARFDFHGCFLSLSHHLLAPSNVISKLIYLPSPASPFSHPAIPAPPTRACLNLCAIQIL